MHPTDEMSLHQSVTPLGKTIMLSPLPQWKKVKTQQQHINTKQKIKYRKQNQFKPNHEHIFTLKITKTNKNTTLPLQKVQLLLENQEWTIQKNWQKWAHKTNDANKQIQTPSACEYLTPL